MNDLCGNINNENKKIKVTSAEIVVQGTVERPYYEIKYYDLDGKCHIGYSSYNLNYVFEWLEECFDIIDGEEWDGHCKEGIDSRSPFSTAGLKFFGTVPPTTDTSKVRPSVSPGEKRM